MSPALKHWTLGRVVSAPPSDRLDQGGDAGEWLGYHGPMLTGMLLPLSGGGQMDETLSDWCELGINYFLRLDWTGYRYEKPCIAPLNYSKCLEDVPDQRPDQWVFEPLGSVLCKMWQIRTCQRLWAHLNLFKTKEVTSPTSEQLHNNIHLQQLSQSVIMLIASVVWGSWNPKKVPKCPTWKVLAASGCLVFVVLVTSRRREKHCTTLLKASKVLCKSIRHALLIDLHSGPHQTLRIRKFIPRPSSRV